MRTFRARVVNGRLVVEEPCQLPEGTVVHLAIAEDLDELDDSERAERDAAIERAWSAVESGERGRPVDELLGRLRPSG